MCVRGGREADINGLAWRGSWRRPSTQQQQSEAPFVHSNEPRTVCGGPPGGGTLSESVGLSKLKCVTQQTNVAVGQKKMLFFDGTSSRTRAGNCTILCFLWAQVASDVNPLLRGTCWGMCMSRWGQKIEISSLDAPRSICYIVEIKSHTIVVFGFRLVPLGVASATAPSVIYSLVFLQACCRPLQHQQHQLWLIDCPSAFHVQTIEVFPFRNLEISIKCHFAKKADMVFIWSQIR